MAQEDFNLDDLFSQLQNDGTSKKTSKIKKVRMNSPEIEGANIIALPIIYDNSFYVKLDSVRELNTTSKFYRDGENEVWIQLLDKSAYGELTEEESNLWTETKDNLEKLIDASGDFYLCRFRKYVLMPVYILKFVDKMGVEKSDMVGTSLLIFPSHNIIRSLSDAATMMTNNMGGNQWRPLVFSPKLIGREGAISIKFSRSTTTKGYDCSTNIIMNTQWSPVVDPKRDYDEGLEFDPLHEFLSWRAGDDKLFNKEVIEELNESTLAWLKKFEPKEEDDKGDQKVDVLESDDAQTPNPEPTSEQPKNTPF